MIENETSGELLDFSGTVPCFPLPDTVHFPGVLLPLHVFEERYRAMVEDALAGERLIAMALLQPGWEPMYESLQAPIHKMVCVGQIAAAERLADGRFHLVLRGLQRGRVIGESVHEGPDTAAYRLGEIELVPDSRTSVLPFDEVTARRRLVDALRSNGNTALEEVVHRVLDEDVPLGMLCDVLAFAMPGPSDWKQRLLAEPNVHRRCSLLLEHLQQSEAATGREFPPRFSRN